LKQLYIVHFIIALFTSQEKTHFRPGIENLTAKAKKEGKTRKNHVFPPFFAFFAFVVDSGVWFNTPELCSGSNNATLTKIWY
jgi:hypothetical protein